MAAPEDADEAEVVQRNATGELRGAPGLVGAVAVVHRPAWTSHRRENLPHKKKQKQKTQISSSFGFFFFKLCLHFYFLLSSFSRSLGLWTSLKNNNRNKKTKTQSRPLASIKQTVTGGPSTTQSDHLRTFSLLFLNFVFQGPKNIKSDGPNVIDKNEKAAVAGRLKD
jgi:hypothetical protein